MKMHLDIKPGSTGKFVQFIGEKNEIEILKNALTFGENKLYDTQSDIVKVAENRCVLRVPVTHYENLRQLNPEDAIIRIGRPRHPLWQIAFQDQQKAVDYAQCLRNVSIKPIHPELKNKDGSLMHPNGTWINQDVYSNRGEYIIRIDAETKLKLETCITQFSGLPSFQELQQTETQLNILLTNFYLHVLLPCKNSQYAPVASANRIYTADWMSCSRKVEEIRKQISECIPASVHGFFNGNDRKQFLNLCFNFNSGIQSNSDIQTGYVLSALTENISMGWNG